MGFSLGSRSKSTGIMRQVGGTGLCKQVGVSLELVLNVFPLKQLSVEGKYIFDILAVL